MSVLVNFKICDNADVCSGIEVCPTGAIYWDEKNSTLAFCNEKCTCCGLCVNACPAGAIIVANNEVEHSEFQKNIDDDPRTIKDLMVERYGASAVDEATMIPVSRAKEIVAKSVSVVAIEVVDDSDTQCLIDSVPIAEIFPDGNCTHFKIDARDEHYADFSSAYGITDIPTFLLFAKGQLLFKFDGVVQNQVQKERTDFINAIRNTLNQK